MLHARFVFNTTLIRRTGRRSLETIKKIGVLSDLIKNWRENILILNDGLCFFLFLNLQQNVYTKEKKSNLKTVTVLPACL
jgi:hypothetical protein